MPDVIGFTGRVNTTAGWSGVHLWKGVRRFLDDVAYRRRTQSKIAIRSKGA